MIGMQHLKYFPKKIFQLEKGLTLYESKIKSHDGSRGAICGRRKFFTDTNMKVGSQVSLRAYFTEYVRLYQCDFWLRNHVPLIRATELDFHDFENPESLTIDEDLQHEDDITFSSVPSKSFPNDADACSCGRLNPPYRF